MKEPANIIFKERKTFDQYSGILIKDRRDNESAYLRSYMDLNSPGTSVIDAAYFSGRKKINSYRTQNIIGIDSLNRISSLNEFITKVNNTLPNGGLFAGKFYPEEARVGAVFRSYYDAIVSKIVYCINFLWNFICSKFKVSDKYYRKTRKVKTNNLPFAEALGRVAAGGFKILDYKQFGKFIYFVARKTAEPSFDPSESHGAIFKMERVGEGGKIKKYYKFRTMYLYAEYLQNFIYQQNGLKDGNKFNDDFRVTKLGNFLRKYWLDELPMIINLFKGDLKLVGVRPLSNQKFNLYSKNLQQYRTKFKPGLIPPFYADMPDSLSGLMESEMKYLKLYERNPLKTDFKYFFKTLYNILVKGARSL